MGVVVQKPGMSSGGGLGQVMSIFNTFGGNKNSSTPGSTPGDPGTDPNGVDGQLGLGGKSMSDQLGQQGKDLSNAMPSTSQSGFTQPNPQMDATNAMLRRQTAMVNNGQGGNGKGMIGSLMSLI